MESRKIAASNSSKRATLNRDIVQGKGTDDVTQKLTRFWRGSTSVT